MDAASCTLVSISGLGMPATFSAKPMLAATVMCGYNA